MRTWWELAGLGIVLMICEPSIEALLVGLIFIIVPITHALLKQEEQKCQ